MKSIIASLLLFLIGAKALELPTDITLCKKSDTECIKSSFMKFAKYFANGNKEFGIPSIEPLAIKEVNIAGRGGAMDLKQIYHDVKVYGATNVVPNEIVITEKGSELIIDMKTRASIFGFCGNYEAKGKMMLFQINGFGVGNLTMENADISIHIVNEIVVKGGEKYLHAKELELGFLKCHLVLNYDNLINNNPELSKTVLDAMNTAEKEVFDYLKTDYEKVVALGFKDVVNILFSKVPLNKLFLD